MPRCSPPLCSALRLNGLTVFAPGRSGGGDGICDPYSITAENRILALLRAKAKSAPSLIQCPIRGLIGH
jgi:hypothetical protein